MAKHARTGRWSKIRTRFLEENHPDELARMQKDGTLDDYMNRIEDEYNERYDRMQQEQLDKTQLEQRYSRKEINWQSYVGEYNQIRATAAEILTHELSA